jgi:hypothetical protein
MSESLGKMAPAHRVDTTPACGLNVPPAPIRADVMEWMARLLGDRPYNDRGREAWLALVPERFKK